MQSRRVLSKNSSGMTKLTFEDTQSLITFVKHHNQSFKQIGSFISVREARQRFYPGLGCSILYLMDGDGYRYADLLPINVFVTPVRGIRLERSL